MHANTSAKSEQYYNASYYSSLYHMQDVDLQ